jgi:hypothetical protein
MLLNDAQYRSALLNTSQRLGNNEFITAAGSGD